MRHLEIYMYVTSCKGLILLILTTYASLGVCLVLNLKFYTVPICLLFLTNKIVFVQTRADFSRKNMIHTQLRHIYCKGPFYETWLISKVILKRLRWVRFGSCLTPYQRLRLYNGDILKRKKDEIWPSPMLKAPLPTEKSKSNVTTQNDTNKFDYIAIADRLKTVSWSSHSYPIGVVKPVYGIPTIKIPANAVQS